MIKPTRGDLLLARADALVNAVNTVGVMGKGIALRFKERFPENYRAYAAACRAGDVRVGKMFVTASVQLDGPRWIINFPTKEHWRHPAQLEWVRTGLAALAKVIHEMQIMSVAIPALGCGNGGLDWCQVRPLIEEALSGLMSVEVLLYEPAENDCRMVGANK